MQRLLKVALLLLLGVYLYSRLLNDAIYFYINERFVTLTLLAAAGLVLVGASYLFRPSTGDGEEHHHHSSASWAGLLIVAAPIVLGWLVPPAPLGAAALGNRELNVGGRDGSGSLASVPPGQGNRLAASGEKNILDWLTAFQHEPDPGAFTGEEAQVTGFVYRDDRFQTGTFLVARYVVSCCVADASPVGLIVQAADADALLADEWVEIKGRFQPGAFGEHQVPVLIAEEVTPTEAPAQPYLYP